MPVHVDAAEGVTMFMLENVAVVIWFQQPTAASVERLDRRIANLRFGQRQAMTMVHLVKVRLQVPDDASRTAMLRLMTDNDVKLMVVVLPGGGFVVSMLRSVITGLRVLMGNRFDFRFDESIDSVAASVPKQHRAKTGVEIDPQRLLDLLRAADRATP
jgi:hypothetical protein